MNREDYLLLNEATTLWGAVQRENFQDRQLVTEAEWNEWRQYDSAVSAELNAIIDRFVNELSAGDRRYLENLQQRVGEAKRMSAKELEARSAGAHSALRAKLRGNLLPQ